MDASLNGNELLATEVKVGNDRLLVCATTVRNPAEAKRIEAIFLRQIAQCDLHVIEIRSKYLQNQGRLLLSAAVVDRRLVFLGQVCSQG